MCRLVYVPAELRVKRKHTVINNLHLLNLRLIPIENILQRISNLSNDTLARALELRQLVRLLDEGIEGPDLEFRDREGGGRPAVWGDDGGDGVQGVVAVVRRDDGGGEGEEEVLAWLGHGDSSSFSFKGTE